MPLLSLPVDISDGGAPSDDRESPSGRDPDISASQGAVQGAFQETDLHAHTSRRHSTDSSSSCDSVSSRSSGGSNEDRSTKAPLNPQPSKYTTPPTSAAHKYLPQVPLGTAMVRPLQDAPAASFEPKPTQDKPLAVDEPLQGRPSAAAQEAAAAVRIALGNIGNRCEPCFDNHSVIDEEHRVALSETLMFRTKQCQ